ncbi:MAG: hypothetical protein FJZ78_07155 [Bacteroidetes bacterium]|nr:hypothetical protein [Bacteroidota bacterium]
MFRATGHIVTILLLSSICSFSQVFIDPGLGYIINTPQGWAAPRLNIGLHNAAANRLGYYLTLEYKNNVPGEAAGGLYFRDIIGLNLRLTNSFYLYGGMGVFSKGILSSAPSVTPARKEIGLSYNNMKSRFNIDLGYSSKIGVTANIGYVIAEHHVGPDRKNKFKELTFPLETIYAELQKRNIRKWLSRFAFTFTTGGGQYFINHQLDGLGYFQSRFEGPYLFDLNSLTESPVNGVTGIKTWVTNARPVDFRYTGNDQLFGADTIAVKYAAKAAAGLANVQLAYQSKYFRAGVGIGSELIANAAFSTKAFDGQLRPIRFGSGPVSLRKYYVYLGAPVYRVSKFTFGLDVQVGQYGFKKNYNNSAYVADNYINTGAFAEYALSEYLSVVARPSYESKSWTQEISALNTSIPYSSRSVGISVGLNYRLPELPRCYLESCQIQINHAHGNKQYRSNAHPLTRKQNPGYGENYPARVKISGLEIETDFKGRFSIMASLGFGSANLSHSISGLGLYQSASSTGTAAVTGPYLFLPSTQNQYAGFSQWITGKQSTSFTINPGDLVAIAYPNKFKLTSKTFTFPVNLTIAYRAGKANIGAGLESEVISNGQYTIKQDSGKFRPIALGSGPVSILKYFTYVGLDLFENKDYTVTADMRLGQFHFTKNYNAPEQRTSWYTNVGFMAQRKIIPGLQAYIRPSAELKGWVIPFEELDLDIRHQAFTFYLSAGVRYTLP